MINGANNETWDPSRKPSRTEPHLQDLKIAVVFMVKCLVLYAMFYVETNTAMQHTIVPVACNKVVIRYLTIIRIA